MKVVLDGNSFAAAARSRLPQEALSKAIAGAIQQADAVGWTQIRMSFGQYRPEGSGAPMQASIYREDEGQPEKTFMIDLHDDGSVHIHLLTRFVAPVA
jgi:hypothetical protein